MATLGQAKALLFPIGLPKSNDHAMAGEVLERLVDNVQTRVIRRVRLESNQHLFG